MLLKDLRLDISSSKQILLLTGEHKEVLTRYKEDEGYTSTMGTYIPDEEMPNLRVLLVKYFPKQVEIYVEWRGSAVW